jgi:hypothetical protein
MLRIGGAIRVLGELAAEADAPRRAPRPIPLRRVAEQ